MKKSILTKLSVVALLGFGFATVSTSAFNPTTASASAKKQWIQHTTTPKKKTKKTASNVKPSKHVEKKHVKHSHK